MIDSNKALLVALLIIALPSVACPSGKPDYKEPAGMTSIEAGEYTFRATISGDHQDEPVILLHGFPETSYMWRELQTLLAKNGFLSIAFDQRGYSPSARPRGRRHYSLDLLAQDVIAVADSLGVERFHLVGHDWGSAAGWAVAAAYPERVLTWTAMSVPHLDAFASAIRDDPAQHKASGYMRAFQWPLVPEIFLKSKDYRGLRSVWNQSSQEEVEAYLSVFSQSGAVTAALNWYRANYRSLTRGESILSKVSVPTLFIWGEKDSAILRSGVKLNSHYITGDYSEHYIDAGHWLIQEAFSEVSVLILEQLRRRWPP
jgi:pimeloyl-ACP methyl ester carboxylesterase